MRHSLLRYGIVGHIYTPPLKQGETHYYATNSTVVVILVLIVALKKWGHGNPKKTTTGDSRLPLIAKYAGFITAGRGATVVLL